MCNVSEEISLQTNMWFYKIGFYIEKQIDEIWFMIDNVRFSIQKVYGLENLSVITNGRV